MEKKMFYQIDNSDVNQIVEADLVMDVIKAKLNRTPKKQIRTMSQVGQSP